MIANRKEIFAPIEIPTWQEFKDAFLFGLLAIFDNVASLVVNKVDIFMIAFYFTLDKVAVYNLAFFMSIVISVPSRSILIIAATIISRSVHDKDYENVTKIYQKSSLTMVLLGGIIFLLIWLNFDNILIAGNLPVAFQDAKYVFFFLGISKLIDLFGSVNGSILLATPFYKYNLYFNLILLVITILLNIIFIPAYGIEGAAIATAISLALFNLMKGIFLYLKYHFQPFHRNSVKALSILGAVWAAGHFFPEMGNPWVDMIVRSAVVSMLFFPAIIYFRISEDINDMFYKILRRVFK
jgi:O-antigen/teichoic acid export membrane protein